MPKRSKKPAAKKAAAAIIPGKQAKALGGRPTKFSPEIGAEIALAVKEIGYLAIAAEHVGIHRNTAYNWQKAGLAGDPEFAEFAHQLLTARAAWFKTQLGKVRNAEWLLERADPTLFGPKAEPPVHVNVNQAPLTREQALARLAELAKDDPGVRAVLEAQDTEPR